jgi:CheY-like chemotaxis protein
MAARILVADDSVTMQKVVELTFSKEDVVLVQARSGDEAIRKAKEVRPDLVLLDLVMPDKNGYQVCAALRTEPTLRTVPIILLTGTFEPFDREQGIRAGANDFVTKPFESQVLISKVKQLLFSKTVEMAAPVGAGKTVSPGLPRPAPAAVVPPQPRLVPPPRPPDIPPAPGPAAGPARAAAPAVSAPPPTATPPVMPSALPAPAGPPGHAVPPPMPPLAGAPGRKPAPEPAAAPSRVGPVSELPPPTEELSQDRLWHALESTPLPTPSREADFGELNLEDLAPLPSPAPFDLAPAEVVTPPATLSLEELLSPLPITFPRRELGGPEPEGLPAEAVFDLTGEMEAPPLPLVEVGTGEPPPLSVEELLVSAEAAGSEVARPEPDLEWPSAVPPEEIPGAPDLSGLTTPLEFETLGGLPLAEPEAAVAEAPVAEERIPVPTPQAPPVTPSMQELPSLAPAVPVGAEPLGTEMATMRQAVTERVAHELARDLSDKMLERIERIVWEVVPDLAEILITKEIERIRALAEGKQSS